MTSLSDKSREWDSFVGSILRTNTLENQLSESPKHWEVDSDL